MWIRYLIGLIVCAVVAFLVTTLLPGTLGYVVSVIAGVGALIFIILLIVSLLPGRGTRV